MARVLVKEVSLKLLIFLSLKLCQHGQHSCCPTLNIHVLPMSLWSYCVQPFTLYSPSSLFTLPVPSLHPTSHPCPKIKTLNQSTKGPPVRLAWRLCYGESLFFNVPRPIKFESAKWGELKRDTINPPHSPRPRGSEAEAPGQGCDTEVQSCFWVWICLCPHCVFSLTCLGLSH